MKLQVDRIIDDMAMQIADLTKQLVVTREENRVLKTQIEELKGSEDDGV